MAGGYVCEGCGGANPVNWLFTRFNPAVTLCCCEADMPTMLLVMLAQWLEVEPDWLQAAVDDAVEQAGVPQEALDAHEEVEAQAEAAHERAVVQNEQERAQYALDAQALSRAGELRAQGAAYDE